MYLKPTKGSIDPQDVPLEDDLQRLAARKKMDRTPAFKQLQGYSKQLSVLTKGRVNLQYFELGRNYCVRPVGQNERRATVPGASQDESFIVAWLLLGIQELAITDINIDYSCNMLLKFCIDLRLENLGWCKLNSYHPTPFHFFKMWGGGEILERTVHTQSCPGNSGSYDPYHMINLILEIFDRAIHILILSWE